MMNYNNDKKRVCIATWYGPENYGTGLQAYALFYYLQKNNYETYFIEQNSLASNIGKYKKLFEIKNYIIRSKNSIKRLVLGYRKYQCKYYNDLKQRSMLQKEFLQEYIKIFKVKNKEDIEKLNKETDIFISGSDQIWNPYVLDIQNMLCMACDDKKKISYASSVGVKHIPSKYNNIYKKYIERYNVVSVRENQSKIALSEIVNKEITVVADPTLLLTYKDWDILANKATINPDYFSGGYILCYFVGKRKSYWEYVEKIRKATDLKVIVLPINDESFINNYEKYAKATPKEFIWLIKNATIICTDSFHATLFSVQYKKEFYVLKRFKDTSKKSQNSRLIDILLELKLESRLIDNEDKFVRDKIYNYKFVSERLMQMRETSQKWLLTMIEKA